MYTSIHEYLFSIYRESRNIDCKLEKGPLFSY